MIQQHVSSPSILNPHPPNAALSLRSNPHTARAAVPPGPSSAADHSMSYGAHMALAMGIGFLFLGEGRLAFGTRRTQVAGLLIALLPPFPVSSADNAGLHQALRHLYALAAEPRCFEALDAESGAIVHVPVTLSLRERRGAAEAPGAGAAPHAREPPVKASGEAMLSTPTLRLLDAQLTGKGADTLPQPSNPAAPRHAIVTPGMLPDLDLVAGLELACPRYHAQRLAGQQLCPVLASRRLWVQPNGSAMPYALDPGGVRSLLGRVLRSEPAPGAVNAPREELAELAAVYGEPGWVAGFARELCGDEDGGNDARRPDWVAAALAPAESRASAGLASWARGQLLGCVGQRRAASVLEAALDALEGGPEQAGPADWLRETGLTEALHSGHPPITP